jgi:hypothetical protein
MLYYNATELVVLLVIGNCLEFLPLILMQSIRTDSAKQNINGLSQKETWDHFYYCQDKIMISEHNSTPAF